MFAVNAETGAVLWQKPAFTSLFGGNLAFGDNLLFATDTQNRLVAVDPADGKVLWNFADAKAPLCSPLAADGLIYVGSLDTWLYALDARSGKVVWKLETGGRICGQPRIIAGKLYCTSDDGQLTEVELPQ
jgi:outer membrane protein assembly factor BamB